MRPSKTFVVPVNLFECPSVRWILPSFVFTCLEPMCSNVKLRRFLNHLWRNYPWTEWNCGIWLFFKPQSSCWSFDPVCRHFYFLLRSLIRTLEQNPLKSGLNWSVMKLECSCFEGFLETYHMGINWVNLGSNII